MRLHGKNLILATTAITAASVWLCAWLAGMYLDSVPWSTRYLVLGLGVLLTMLFILFWVRQDEFNKLEASQRLAALGRLELNDLSPEAEGIELPPMSADNPWFGLAHGLTNLLVTSCQRAEKAQHSCAALEVRVQRLRQDREQMKAILDSLSEPVLAIDQYDEILLANPSACALLDIDTEVDESQTRSQLGVNEPLIDLLIDTRRRMAPTERTSEIEITDRQGEKQWYRVMATDIEAAGAAPGEENGARGAVAVLRNIGNEKDAQKRHAEFVSAVSHEMKTPLAGIKAYVELLVDGDDEDEQAREEFLGVINSQTERLQRLIDNLLNLARIEAGVVSVSKQSRSLNEMLEEAVHVVQPAADEKHIDLQSDLSPLYLSALADRDLILQAAINLLSNAIKYTPQGGTVTLRSRMQDEQIEFEVEDTGVGLCEEDCERVFDKFYRVGKDRQMAQGTGLGLPLAKHIVEDVHGGWLTVISEVGVGSTFRVTLPGAGQLTTAVPTA